MITMNEIRNNLCEAIKLGGLSQTELAKKLNIKQPTISKYLAGKAMPSLDTFANLCVILDLDPSDILNVDNEKKKQ